VAKKSKRQKWTKLDQLKYDIQQIKWFIRRWWEDLSHLEKRLKKLEKELKKEKKERKAKKKKKANKKKKKR